MINNHHLLIDALIINFILKVKISFLIFITFFYSIAQVFVTLTLILVVHDLIGLIFFPLN